MLNKKIVLSCENITKSFSVSAKSVINQKIEILKGVSLNVYKGDFVVILGQSGSGKTTLLNILAGLDVPSSGNVYFNGKKLNINDNDSMDALRSKKIGYIFQNYGLIPICNVYDNVCLGLVDEIPDKKRVMDLLKKLKIDHIFKKFPDELSGGQKQRVSIARALIKNPEIIFLDEPTGALDNETTLEIFEIFKKLRDDKKTLLVVTHDERFINLATKVIRIKDGLIDNPLIIDDIKTYNNINERFDICSEIEQETLRIKDFKPYENVYGVSEKNNENNNYVFEEKKKEYLPAKKTSNISCINLSNVSKKIVAKKNETLILNDVNLDINVGDFTIIFGESGSGKSTLLGIMSGLDSSFDGNINVLGTNIKELSNQKLLNWRKENIGFVFQVNSLLPDLSVIDNALLTTNNKNKQFAIDLLEYLGLGKVIKTKIKHLSGGQQQRVAIARSILKFPKILFADEPTGAVDSKTSIDIVNIFKEINEKYGITIIMVTHNHNLLEIGNRIIEIKDGKVIQNTILDFSIDVNSLN